MKKLIVTLIIIMGIASESISQTSKDSICLPIDQLKKAINTIERGKVMEEELSLVKNKLQLKDSLIVLKDSIISQYVFRENNYQSLMSNYQTNIKNDGKIIDNLQTTINLSKKISKRQAVSKWIVGILGLSIGYLIAK
jgi:uncharacterized protein YdcH (DUF465 family)